MTGRDGSMPGVLVLGAESQGLGILRQLGDCGIPTFTVDQDRLGIARFSRFSRGFSRSPRYADTEDFASFLLELAGRRGLRGWTVFPTDDEQVKALSVHREVLGGEYRIWTQGWETLSVMYRKDLFYRFASGLGIDCPATVQVESPGQAQDTGLDFPVIVKPAVKTLFYSRFRKKAVECPDPDSLARFLTTAAETVPLEHLLVQERIPGMGENQFSCAGLALEGRILFHLRAQRVRQHPMDFGHASTYVRLSPDADILGDTAALLEATGYSGVFEAEFMLDRRREAYRLLEVNPRFWGWHTLTRACGVNLPLMLYCLVYGLDLPESGGMPERADWVKNLTDLPVALGQLLRGRLPLPDLLRQHLCSTENATFRISDPLPFLAEWMMVPYLWLKRGY